MEQSLFLKDGTLFADEFIRVVHGGRGDYVEFELNQIKPELHKKFGEAPDYLGDPGIYYEWMYPADLRSVKVYKQLRTVAYADYIPGKYYVSPDMFLNFKDPEKLF